MPGPCHAVDAVLTACGRYVEMLENQQTQLVTGLQELYKRLQNGQGWSGSPLKETNAGVPLTHDILERLGALKVDGHQSSEAFEEDLSALQQRLIANGASIMQREPSHDGSSESAASPPYEPRLNFTNPFPVSHMPPTPPNQSPYPQMARTTMPMKSNTYPQVSQHSNLSYTMMPGESDDGMDYLTQFDSSMLDQPLDMNNYSSQMFADVPAPNMFYSTKDWTGQDEMQKFVNPAMIS